MSTFVAELEPRALWAHFDRLLAIPRPSKKEAAARAYVMEVAAAHGLATRADAAGNVVVVKPASPGRERAPKVVLQSHLDMVCEKNAGVTFDFERDAIVPRRDGEWLRATGTTLGADNGIGAAAMLAVAEATDIEHGPLELLFTIEEEIGLLGALALDPALVTGRVVLNLDTEAERTLYIGCSGGAGGEIVVPLDTMFGADGRVALAIRLGGLRGGHSGVDIHLQRGNSIRILARALHALWLDHQFEMADFAGGNLPNAIPREASALVRVTRDERAGFERELAALLGAVKAELAAVDPDLTLGGGRGRRAARGLVGRHDGARARAPRGHSARRRADERRHARAGRELLQSGARRAPTARCGSRSATGARSPPRSRRCSGASRLSRDLAGGMAEVKPGYPGWKPNLASPTLAVLQRASSAISASRRSCSRSTPGSNAASCREKLPGIGHRLVRADDREPALARRAGPDPVGRALLAVCWPTRSASSRR